jgi:hypothetical protein
MMNDEGKLCPSCNADIGVWPHIKSAWPNAGLKCPYCRKKLKYNPAGWGLFLFLTVVYMSILLIAFCMTIRILIIKLTFFEYMILIVTIGYLTWLPFDLFAAHNLREKSKLELK